MTARKGGWARLVAALVLLGLGATAPVRADPGVLVVGKAQDIRTLDPAVTMTNQSWTVTYPAYERLVRYRVEAGVGITEVEGELAARWTASPDGRVWTFTLAEGHAFDDGSAVTADAVKFTFDRLLDMNQGPAGAFAAVESVEAVNARTVRFRLATPFAPFLYSLANNGAGIVNPAVAVHAKDGDHAGGWLSAHTAGSGPYRLARWDLGQRLVMEPNPHYGGPKPRFRRVEVRIIKDATARRLQLERGDIDIAESLPVDQQEALRGRPDIRVAAYPSLQVTYLYLNNRRPPLDDVRVRRAITRLIDYDAIIDGILLGHGQRLSSPVPKGLWGHEPDLPRAERDVAAARALLAEAGVGRGLALGYLYAESDPNWAPIGLTVQANLAEAGIRVRMESFAYATMRDKLDRGDFDIAIGNWTPDFSDPYMFTNYWFDSGNFGLAGNRSFYRNDEVDALLREAAESTDRARRRALYAAVQRTVVDAAAYVYLFQRDYRVVMRTAVEGYVYNPMLLDIYNLATMSKRE